MTLLALQNFARTGAGVLVDSLLIGFLVAAIAWAVLALLRNHRAAIRFAVLSAALASIAVLPALRTFAGSRTVSTAAPLLHLGQSCALALAALWAAGAVIGLTRVCFGIVNLRRMRRRCRPVSLSADLEQTVRQFCPSRRVQILAGNAVSVPSAIGFFRPAVILPPWLLDELSPAELRHILIHELSHLRRRDDWTNLFQRIMKSLFFFHPAVWWMETRLSLEREMACDDAVLAQSPSARDYAECLTRIAEKSLLRRGLAMAQAAVSRMRETTCRVARILQFDRGARGGKVAVSLATVFAVTGFGALLQAPTLVSFSNRSIELSPSVALASSRQFRRHLTGSARAINAAWHPRPEGAVHHGKTQVVASSRPVTKRERSTDALWKARAAAPAERAVMQAKQSKPSVHAVQAGLTSDSIRGATFVFVTQDQNTFTVWRITTWEFVPSRQARADHKTT